MLNRKLGTSGGGRLLGAVLLGGFSAESHSESNARATLRLGKTWDDGPRTDRNREPNWIQVRAQSLSEPATESLAKVLRLPCYVGMTLEEPAEPLFGYRRNQTTE